MTSLELLHERVTKKYIDIESKVKYLTNKHHFILSADETLLIKDELVVLKDNMHLYTKEDLKKLSFLAQQGFCYAPINSELVYVNGVFKISVQTFYELETLKDLKKLYFKYIKKLKKHQPIH